ncbi:MAG: hypothetical protein ABWX90_03310 [Candidatus Saccharimonadales bacterium]
MSILTEIRNAFGFPQFITTQQEEKETSNNQLINYTINSGEDEEDYFDQLGTAV